MNVRHIPIWRAASLLVVLTMLVLTGLPAAPPRVAFAYTTGPISPEADVAETGGDGDGFEINPTYAYFNGDWGGGGVAESRDTCDTAPCIERHQFYNYGLTLPADALILGVQVRADWWVDDVGGENWLGIDMSWDGGTNWTSLCTDLLDPEPTAERIAYCGSSTSLWGRTWSPSDFNDGNFIVRVHISSDVTERDFFLDWISVRVTYNRTPDLPINQTPANGGFAAAANPQFAWTFSDPDTGDVQNVFQVQLRTPAGTYGDLGSWDSGIVTSALNTYTPSNWNLGLGTYCWHVRVQDNSGAPNAWTAYSDETCFTIERTAPVSAATSPSYDAGGTIPVGWTASDNAGGSGVDTVALWYKFNAGSWTDTGMSQSGSAGTFVFSPPGDAEGTYHFQTIATDVAGNVEAGPTGDGDDSTIYDTTPPISLSAPPPGPVNATTIPIPWAADGSVSGIAPGGILLRYNFNGGTFVDGPTASGTVGTFNFAATEDGTYCFYTIATDNAGNVEAAPAVATGDGCTIFHATLLGNELYLPSVLRNY